MSPTNFIGHRFIELLTVESTNNYAMGLLHAGMAQHGIAVFAHEQTKGKGQRHKQWHSTPNENIILSVIIEPGLSLSQQFLLSMCVAVGAHRFFAHYAGDEAKIKWPNDLYWRDRKAGGILIENVVNGMDWKYAVAGIGININQTGFEQMPHAVSLKQITGKEFSSPMLAKELLSQLDLSFRQLKQEPQTIVQAYQQHLYKRNETVWLKKENRVFQTTVKGVAENGLLITYHTVEEKFGVGEIEWLIR